MDKDNDDPDDPDDHDELEYHADPGDTDDSKDSDGPEEPENTTYNDNDSYDYHVEDLCDVPDDDQSYNFGIHWAS